MPSPSIDRSKMQVVSAREVKPDDLQFLYESLYENHGPFLAQNWHWYYRSEVFDNQIPLVLRYENQAIGTAGMIPVFLTAADKKYTASWFIDFAIIEAFQRKGLGTILTKKWMEFADMQITFCNEKSIGVFLKLGWSQSFDTFLQIYFLAPFSVPQLQSRIPRSIAKIADFLVRPFIQLVYRRFSRKKSSWQIEKLDQRKLDNFISNFEEKTTTKNYFFVKRDKDFFSWRLLQSPEKGNYFIFSIPGISAIVALKKKKGTHLDILLLSSQSDKKLVKQILASLALYGIQQGASYMRIHSSFQEVSSYIKKGLPALNRSPRFAFFSKDEDLYQKMKNATWDWQLIDSDFENMGKE